MARISENFSETRQTSFSIPVIIRQALKALRYLHKNRILHGDIKPENIVITEDKDHDIETKLLDFGLAMSLGDERKLMSGTLRYLAPEILLHGRPNSPATDLYALGVSLIESILSIEVPGSNEMNEAVLREHVCRSQQNTGERRHKKSLRALGIHPRFVPN